jgi:hypothetical protein
MILLRNLEYVEALDATITLNKFREQQIAEKIRDYLFNEFGILCEPSVEEDLK